MRNIFFHVKIYIIFVVYIIVYIFILKKCIFKYQIIRRSNMHICAITSRIFYTEYDKRKIFFTKKHFLHVHVVYIFNTLFLFFSFFFTNIIEKDVLLSYLGVCKTILKNLHITTHGIQKFFLCLFHKMFFFHACLS